MFGEVLGVLMLFRFAVLVGGFACGLTLLVVLVWGGFELVWVATVYVPSSACLLGWLDWLFGCY